MKKYHVEITAAAEKELEVAVGRRAVVSNSITPSWTSRRIGAEIYHFQTATSHTH